MRFKQYLLNEAGAHKTALEVAEAVALIKEHCGDALKLKEPLWRGMNPGSDSFLLNGEASTRESANTSNFYTNIMDNFLPSLGYPKRSKSIILANDLDTADAFGAVYAVFPYDGVKIGVCAAYDLWSTPSFQIGDSEDDHRIHNWNGIWRSFDLPQSSYLEFVDAIKEKMSDDSGGSIVESLIQIFGTPDNVEAALEKAYSPEGLKLELATTKTIDNYSDTKRELWIGGKCVAIRRNFYTRLKTEGTL